MAKYKIYVGLASIIFQKNSTSTVAISTIAKYILKSVNEISEWFAVLFRFRVPVNAARDGNESWIARLSFTDFRQAAVNLSFKGLIQIVAVAFS